MRKIILATVLAGIGSTAAWSADLGAPDVQAAQVYSWTGIYIGGDAGFAGIKHNFTSNFSQPSADPNNANNIQENAFSSTPFVGGGHAGFNWQFTPNLVVGIEGDWQSVHSRQSFCRQTDIGSTACVDGNGNNRGFASAGGELGPVATARARLGWAIDRVMIFGTGGAAFANVKSSEGLSCLDAGCGNSGNQLATAASSSTQRTGWVVGAGFEWMFTQNLIVRGEYQHIDFGSVSSTLIPTKPDCGGCSFSATQKLNVDILRAGVSYKFGG
jgi:outer membrane immunogenic protein